MARQRMIGGGKGIALVDPELQVITLHLIPGHKRGGGVEAPVLADVVLFGMDNRPRKRRRSRRMFRATPPMIAKGSSPR